MRTSIASQSFKIDFSYNLVQNENLYNTNAKDQLLKRRKSGGFFRRYSREKFIENYFNLKYFWWFFTHMGSWRIELFRVLRAPTRRSFDAIKSLCDSRLCHDAQKSNGLKFKGLELIKLNKLRQSDITSVTECYGMLYKSFIMYSRISVRFYRFFALLWKCHLTLRNF